MNYFITIIISFLLGSIPTAYLIVKIFNGKDVRSEGSGNVGALNSLKVSNSKLIGFLVLLGDLIKGALPVLILKFFYVDNFLLPMIGIVVAVIAHCYNPWLKFKGGRGLATAAGGLLLLSPIVVLIWIVIWIVIYLFRKSVHLGNIGATFLTALLAWNVGDIIYKYSTPPPKDYTTFSVSIIFLMVIILTRHDEALKQWLSIQKKNLRGKNENV